ncbi:MAG: hypothetical protein RLZZ136_1049 [Pseudomonadota bacterium]
MGGKPVLAPLPSDSLDLNPARAAMQQMPWRLASRLSSGLDAVEQFLGRAEFDRGPWLAVAFAGGIAAWFGLASSGERLGFVLFLLALALAGLALFRSEGRYPFFRQALIAVALVCAGGWGTVAVKSALVGTRAIAGPWVGTLSGRVLEREEQPADGRVRLTLAVAEPGTGRPIQVRVNVPIARDAPMAREGATVNLRARLVPPAAPMLPGSYDFARAAWFAQLAATGSALGPVVVLRSVEGGASWLAQRQRAISDHVRSKVAGSAGGIAAAFASGDRGGIAQGDEDAMRDAGLSHLLSVSGLHVSAVTAITYFIAMRLLGLWPWLVLRVRLPLLGAGCSALAAIAYTLLTGAQVPTVRSCVGALLVLAALALGREPLSLRLLAVAAFLVMLIWPEAVVGPSFQMSFASVIAIVALHDSAPMRAFMVPREEAWSQRMARKGAMLLITGLVVEVALMPIAIYHFHRAGFYGALANVIAIPLTEMVTMPAIGLGFVLDALGFGGPAWWLTGKSLSTLLAIAHFVASFPGAVTRLPAMGGAAFVLFMAGSLWLALWHGRIRLLGLMPIVIAITWLLTLRPPDLLIAGDGAHLGITGLARGEVVILREPRSDYARERLAEMAGMDGAAFTLRQWPGARCSAAFCSLDLERGGRSWRLLLALGRQPVAIDDLAKACALSDIVVADRWLPPSCRPRALKADRAKLHRTGGMAIDLANGRVETVAHEQGDHPWWNPVESGSGPVVSRKPWHRPWSGRTPPY